MAATVAVASEFFDAFARIPRAEQRRVREFTEKFRQNPRAPGIHYEKIHDVKDDKVRTVRIGRSYRAIVLQPEVGDVHVLVWVDHHDEAMEWAKRKTFEINPVTGALQVFSITEAEEAVRTAKAEEPVPPPRKAGRAPAGLLANIPEEDLLSFGVPRVLLPSVRAVATRDELAALVGHLPAEAAEALTWLGEDMPVGEVRDLVEARVAAKKVDTSDFEAALAHPDSRRRFARISTPHDLQSMLNAPFEKWRVFLHPSQERLASGNFNGPARVLGGAGTGKTVVAMHRARNLAKGVFTEKTDRVLFTTFTQNLAQAVEGTLKSLCEDEMERIEVVHLHAWAVRFMRSQGIEYRIAKDEDVLDSWKEAQAVCGETDWDLGFLRQEWDQVVQAGDLGGRQEYLRVSRVGRGKTLTRDQRARVWKVFEAYRETLRGRGEVEWLDVIRETRKFLEQRSGGILPYRAVVVDEAQDLHPEEWRLIRAIVPAGPNDLFLVGDAHQRIYARKVILSRCGIDIRGRSRKLRINYRTTQQIKEWAEAVLRGVDFDDLDGGRDDRKGYTSLLSGPEPEVHRFDSLEEEKEFLVGTLRSLTREFPPEDVCVAARMQRLLRDEYGPALQAAKVEYTVLDPEKARDGGRAGDGVRLATMHRVKGLEFRCMVLVGIGEGIVPLRRDAIEGDATALREHEERERSLLFVAATRARDRLVITCSGPPSPYLPPTA